MKQNSLISNDLVKKCLSGWSALLPSIILLNNTIY